jgi:hypothetical protein
MAKTLKKPVKKTNGKRARGTPKDIERSRASFAELRLKKARKAENHRVVSREIHEILRAGKGKSNKEIQANAVYNDGTGEQNICLGTIYNLRKKTVRPQFRTMQAFAAGIGRRWILTQTNQP